MIITELSARARATLADGTSKIHIYDNPLQILAALLVLGFVLAILVRPVRHMIKHCVPSMTRVEL